MRRDETQCYYHILIIVTNFLLIFSKFQLIPIVGMEKGLHDRDRVGLQDFVLLENYQSEEAFIDNLKKRFQENLIYVSILNLINMLRVITLQLNTSSDIYWPGVNICKSVQGIVDIF